MTNSFQKIACVLAVAALGVGPALAKEGDWIARAGLANVDPDASSDVLEMDVDDNTQLGLTFAYMVTDHIGVELLAATPFEHEITSAALNNVKVGSVEQLPPTLNVQYYFFGSEANIRPYVGAGLNWTTFFSEDTTSEFESVAGDTKLSLDDSFGLALQVGIDFYLGNRWVVNASVWQLDIDTEATAKTANLGTVNIDVEIDPLVYMVGVGYKF